MIKKKNLIKLFVLLCGYDIFHLMVLWTSEKVAQHLNESVVTLL